MRIVLELDDGRKFEADGSDRTFSCLADRVAFERTFGVPAAVLSKWQGLVDANGVPKEGADLSGVREEWLSFLLWRELVRRADGVPSWDEVIEHVVELTFDEGEAEANPTEGV